MESFSETLSMCLYKRYVWDSGICICYIVSVQNSVTCHLAFASARLMALRRLVAGQALDFEHGLCSICICIYMYDTSSWPRKTYKDPKNLSL